MPEPTTHNSITIFDDWNEALPEWIFVERNYHDPDEFLTRKFDWWIRWDVKWAISYFRGIENKPYDSAISITPGSTLESESSFLANYGQQRPFFNAHKIIKDGKGKGHDEFQRYGGICHSFEEAVKNCVEKKVD